MDCRDLFCRDPGIDKPLLDVGIQIDTRHFGLRRVAFLFLNAGLSNLFLFGYSALRHPHIKEYHLHLVRCRRVLVTLFVNTGDVIDRLNNLSLRVEIEIRSDQATVGSNLAASRNNAEHVRLAFLRPLTFYLFRQFNQTLDMSLFLCGRRCLYDLNTRSPATGLN